VLACADAVAQRFALTRPREALTEAILLSRSMLEAMAQAYDGLTGGHLAAHMAASPPALGTTQGDHPFAWAVARLRQRTDQPGWSWLQQNEDALAALHIVALQDLLHSWGQHPSFARLAAPLAERGRFLRTMTGFALARLLFDAGNRVGFDPPTPGHPDVQLHFSTPAGVALALAMTAPDALQWQARDRRSPQVIRAAVTDALAAAQGRVNSRNPGIVVLSVSILLQDFDQALVDAMHAAFRAVGRRHRGVAAVAAIMPKVLPTGHSDRIGFGYAFYPIRNPHFAGENPIKLGPEQDFLTRGGGA
jgi:hypothetical protein